MPIDAYEPPQRRKHGSPRAKPIIDVPLKSKAPIPSIYSSCIGKTPYDTAYQAEAVIRLRRKSGAPPLRYYHCDHCHMWHLTSQRQRKDF